MKGDGVEDAIYCKLSYVADFRDNSEEKTKIREILEKYKTPNRQTYASWFFVSVSGNLNPGDVRKLIEEVEETISLPGKLHIESYGEVNKSFLDEFPEEYKYDMDINVLYNQRNKLFKASDGD